MRKERGAPKPAPEIKVVARNKKARFQYLVLETYEAGIALVGTEVKSIRSGQISLAESFARVQGDELVLLGAHIDEYKSAGYAHHDPLRFRKLLMHRREIKRIKSALAEKGLTMVPLSVYFKRGLAKVELALVRGKKVFDKRESIKNRDADLSMRRAMSQRRREE